MKPHAISIKQVRTPGELRQAQEIRETVLETEQGFPHEVNVDGQDPSAMHVLVLDRGEPVGTARVTKRSETEGMLARIALLRSHRGKGLGKVMLRHLESVAKHAGLQTIYVEPHAHLEPFFRSLGYETVPGRLELSGHQLILLRRRV